MNTRTLEEVQGEAGAIIEARYQARLMNDMRVFVRSPEGRRVLTHLIWYSRVEERGGFFGQDEAKMHFVHGQQNVGQHLLDLARMAISDEDLKLVGEMRSTRVRFETDIQAEVSRLMAVKE